MKCSFCGKDQLEVGKVISGPNGVNICGECIQVCNYILSEEKLKKKRIFNKEYSYSRGYKKVFRSICDRTGESQKNTFRRCL